MRNSSVGPLWAEALPHSYVLLNVFTSHHQTQKLKKILVIGYEISDILAWFFCILVWWILNRDFKQSNTHAHTHTCTHACTYTCTHTVTHMHTHTNTRTYAYTHKSTSVYDIYYLFVNYKWPIPVWPAVGLKLQRGVYNSVGRAG